MTRLLLLSLAALLLLYGASAQLEFKQQVLYNRADRQRRISVFMSAQTGDAAQLHAQLVFSGARQYHQALLLNPRSLHKYTAVTSQERQLTVLTKGRALDMDYQLGGANESFGGLTPEYDALLSLDRHSSVWREYDTALFEQNRLTLVSGAGTSPAAPVLGLGAAATVNAKSHPHPDDLLDFQGMYQLECTVSGWGAHEECAVALDGLLINDGARPAGSRLLFDFDAHVNLLPLDLYLAWHEHGVREFWLTSASGDEDFVLLRLNDQFQYELNEWSDDLVLGIDVLHYFQRVAYSAYWGRLTLWYSRIYAANATFELHKSLIYWLISLILTCLSAWIAAPNYDVLLAVLAQRHSFEYSYQLVVVELVALVLAPILWLLIFLAGDPWSNAWSGYHHSVVLRRELLIFSFALYHWLLSVLLFLRGTRLIKHTFQHYWYYFKSFVTTRGRYDKELAERETDPVSTKMVLARNLAGHTLMSTNLLLILNYLSEEKLIYCIPFIVASLALVFFYIKALFSAGAYIALQGGWREEPLFTMLNMLSAVVFIVYCVFTFSTHYTSIFEQLNSVYKPGFIRAWTLMLLAFTGCCGALAVYFPVVRRARKLASASSK